MTEGAVSRKVIFPEGCTWVDYYDPARRYEGGTELADYPAPLDRLPSSCVKAPSYPPPTTLWTTPATTAPTTLPSPTTLHLSKATHTLYDDNRMSPRALADSEYRLIHFTGRDEKTAW